MDIMEWASRTANHLWSEPFTLLILVAFALWAGIKDIKTLKIKNKFNITFFLTAVVLMVVGCLEARLGLPAIIPSLTFGWENIYGLLFGWAVMFIPAFIKNHPMGGDIKMSAVLGFWLGFESFVFVLAISLIANLIYWFGALYFWKEYGKKTLMPFAPFFVVGILLFYSIAYFI